MLRDLAIPLCAVLCLSSCKKEPGEGGQAEIRGIVMRQDINENNGQPVGVPYPYPEARVYIRYGDHDFHDDDVRTGPDGLYAFTWLRTGDYTVFTYTECPTCPSGQKEVLRSVEVSDRTGVVTVPTMISDNW